MKKAIKLMMVVAVMVSFASTVLAQTINYNDPKYVHLGKDAAEREQVLRKYSFLRDAFKMNNYEDFMTRFNDLVEINPKTYENMYIYGVRLNKAKYAEATDPAEQDKYAKEVIRMYELQAENYGVKNGKNVSKTPLYNAFSFLVGIDYIKYEKEIKSLSHRILNITENGLDYEFMLIYFGVITNEFLTDRVSPEEVLNEYDGLAQMVEKSNHPEKTRIQQSLDGLLLNSGAADCMNLETLFRAQYEARPNDVELIKKIMRYLNDYNCDGPFKVLLSEKYYKLDPSADAAYSLALTFNSQGDTQKAITYLKEAITRETAREKKAKYQVRLATIYLISKQNQLASTTAKSAIASDPRNSMANFILAQAYSIALANNEVSCEAFEKKAAFWLVLDVLNKAKSLAAPYSNELKDIEKSISAVKANFPSSEDLFFRESLSIGKEYTVNCGWIKGKTTVKGAAK